LPYSGIDFKLHYIIKLFIVAKVKNCKIF